MSQSLYKISEEILSILDSSPEGEIDDGVLAKLTDLEMSFRDKAQAVACVIRMKLTQVQAAKDEAERLKLLAVKRQAQADSLKAYLKKCMEATGQKKLETDLFTIAVNKVGTPTVEYDGELAALPSCYVRTRTTVEVNLDKVAILSAFKAGEKIPEGVKVTQGTYLKIS